LGVEDSDFRQRITQLLNKLPQGDSRLAVRCHDDPEFHRFVVETAKALAHFYGQMDKDSSALRSFESKLRRWITERPDAYFGFAGELRVADWLRRQGVPHLFVRETQKCKTPDIQLMVAGRTVYLEVKTLEESYYDLFAQRVLEEISSFLPNRGIEVGSLKVERGKEEALVARAVKVVHDWCKAPYAPIQYKGEEGEFSIVLPVGGGITGHWTESVDMKRVRKDGTPWAESKLKGTLVESIGKFKTNKPTFLVWVNPHDLALSNSINTHIAQALEQYGQEFADVVGIIVLDPVLGWSLTENQANPEYRQLKDIGLFEAVDALKLL
jgi:hypothetical protein